MLTAAPAKKNTNAQFFHPDYFNVSEEQTTPRMEVLLVGRKVAGEIANSLAQDGYLDLG